MPEEASAVLAKALQARIKRRENYGLLLLVLKMLLYATLLATLVAVFYTESVQEYLHYLPFRPTIPQLELGLFVIVIAIFILDLITLGNLGMIRRARAQLVSELSRRDRAERLSLVDPVTGTFDRRYLDEIIPREAARADRRETTLTFVKLCIEKFETIDPAEKFQTGERVLKETAQLLKRCFRPTDIIIRYGVAEFLVILPETAKHGALTAVRRLLTKVDELNRRRTLEDFVLQLSVGVADYTKGHDVRDALVGVETRVEIYRDSQTL